MKNFGWILFGFFAIIIGLYPVLYFVVDMSAGFLAGKPAELLRQFAWRSAFYLHISLGGLSLLIGWTQFSKKLRDRRISLHRTLGKTYLISVTLSWIAALYLAFHATGGLIAMAGFGGLASFWLATTLTAYARIRNGSTDEHEYFMIRSYALCWAAVMLRIYIPLSQIAGIEFLFAYRIISWLCWVPNLIAAELIIRRLKSRRSVATLVE